MTHLTPLLFWDVDTQVDFMDEEGRLYVPGAVEIIPNLEKLTQLAGRIRAPVVASADDHLLSDPEISESPDFSSTYPPHCIRNTAGAERISATQQIWSLEVGQEPLPAGELRTALVTPRPLVLVKKNTVDVFANPNTEKIVEILAPQRIVLYGVALDVCNRFAIEGLLARGYDRLEVITDATKPIDEEKGARLLQLWGQSGVRALTTDALLAESD